MITSKRRARPLVFADVEHLFSHREYVRCARACSEGAVHVIDAGGSKSVLFVA